jgi:hypothetical protein
MKFELKKVKNGWTFKHIDSEDPGAVWVQEEIWNKEEEAFLHFLWTIIQNFAPIEAQSKFNAKTIVPVILPGHKFMGELSEKYIQDLTELRDRIQGHIDEQAELRLAKPKSGP